MKHFLKIISVASVLTLILVGLFVLIPLWISNKTIPHFSNLSPSDNFLFCGDSLTGCSIVTDPNLGVRVLWQPGIPPSQTLARLKEFERQGKLKNVNVFTTGIGYATIPRENDLDWMRMFNIKNFGLTWRYPSLFPIEVFSSIEYLDFTNWMLPKVELFIRQPAITQVPLERRSQKEQIAIRADNRVPFNGKIFDKKTCDAFLKRLEFVLLEMNYICKRNDITFVVFYSPHHTWAIQDAPPEVEQIMIELKSILTFHKIPVFDCRSVMPDSSFRDCVHLTSNEAKKFTNYLLPLIKQLPDISKNK